MNPKATQQECDVLKPLTAKLKMPAHFHETLSDWYQVLLMTHVLQKSDERGLSYLTHPALFDSIFDHLQVQDLSIFRFQSFMNLVFNELDADPGRALSSLDLDQFWEDADPPMTQGPLNKCKATLTLEKLLARLATLKPQDIQITHDEDGDYFLSIRNEKAIHLSVLLKNANHSHLELSDATVKALGKMLDKHFSDIIESYGAEKPHHMFSDAERTALSIYGWRVYRHINRLLRGEPFVQVVAAGRVSDPLESNSRNHLFCFIVGMLITHANNRAPSLADQQKTLKPNAFPMLDRGEYLTDTVIKARTSNHWRYPALTSFSAHHDGSPYFRREGTTRTKKEGTGRLYQIGRDEESEVIFSGGTHVKTVQGPNGMLFSKMFCSPTLEPDDQVFSDLALKYAYQYHLSQPYRDSDHCVTINGRDVHRPNHGLAHTFRVQVMIDPVIDYFAHFGKDEAFQAFCQNLTEAEREWLRVAAVFSISGRESEIAFPEDPEAYDDFREASMNQMKAYLKVAKSDAPKVEGLTFAQMQTRMAHVVRYMGNPGYEVSFKGRPPINTVKNAIERQQRSFFHRILTVAHKLDLPRCYTPSQFDLAMQPCRDWVVASKEQGDALNRLFRYVIEMMKAQGNRLTTDINTKGELIHHSQPYNVPFDAVSHSIKKLQLITDAVTRPALGLLTTHAVAGDKRAAELKLEGSPKKKVKQGS